MAHRGGHLIMPTSVTATGTGYSATISANGSVSFSACDTLSLNGVFSADYDNYTIVARHDGTTTATVRMRLRSSGTDTAGTGYTVQTLEAYGSTVSAARYTAQSLFIFGPVANTERGGHIINVYGPFLAQPTSARCVSTGPWSAAFPGYMIDSANAHSGSTSFDGCTLMLSGGAFTGRVAVYGMRK